MKLMYEGREYQWTKTGGWVFVSGASGFRKETPVDPSSPLWERLYFQRTQHAKRPATVVALTRKKPGNKKGGRKK